MPDEMFTTVRRGYDPTEVERAVGQAQTEVCRPAGAAGGRGGRGRAGAQRSHDVARGARLP